MNGFTIYKEYYELITLLSEKEQQELLLAITKYMFEDIEPSLNEKQTKIFNNLKRPLDSSKNNSKRSRGNGAPSGNQNAKKTNQETNQNQTGKQTGKQTENKPEDNPKTNQTAYQKQTHQDVNVNVIVNVDVIKEIINYLNLKTNSNYSYSSDKNQRLIKARINEGYTIEDFKIVIDKKYAEWKGTEFEKFLRPETLFSNKFEGYLNQKQSSNTRDEQWGLLKGVYDGTIKVS